MTSFKPWQDCKTHWQSLPKTATYGLFKTYLEFGNPMKFQNAAILFHNENLRKLRNKYIQLHSSIRSKNTLRSIYTFKNNCIWEAQTSLWSTIISWNVIILIIKIIVNRRILKILYSWSINWSTKMIYSFKIVIKITMSTIIMIKIPMIVMRWLWPSFKRCESCRSEISWLISEHSSFIPDVYGKCSGALLISTPGTITECSKYMNLELSNSRR